MWRARGEIEPFRQASQACADTSRYAPLCQHKHQSIHSESAFLLYIAEGSSDGRTNSSNPASTARCARLDEMKTPPCSRLPPQNAGASRLTLNLQFHKSFLVSNFGRGGRNRTRTVRFWRPTSSPLDHTPVNPCLLQKQNPPCGRVRNLVLVDRLRYDHSCGEQTRLPTPAIITLVRTDVTLMLSGDCRFGVKGSHWSVSYCLHNTHEDGKLSTIIFRAAFVCAYRRP